jgi:hypothetical protein
MRGLLSLTGLLLSIPSSRLCLAHCSSDSYYTQATFKMAGRIRQPIDVPALERYIEKNVPAIKTPIDVKQVRMRCFLKLYSSVHHV